MATWFKVADITVMVLTVTSSLAIAFAVIGQCNPISKYFPAYVT